MENENVSLNKQDYVLSNVQENLELVVYSLISFFVPLFLGHPQIVVGVLVNMALVLAAFNLRGLKLLPVIMLPSIGVLCAGLIFGSFTWLLVYMIPFIWIANAILVFGIKKYFVSTKFFSFNNSKILLGASFFKFLFLFTFASIFVLLGLLPSIFLLAMGPLQFGTAIVGGFVAFSVQGVKKEFFF
jgi:hypothetical protein